MAPSSLTLVVTLLSTTGPVVLVVSLRHLKLPGVEGGRVLLTDFVVFVAANVSLNPFADRFCVCWLS